MRLPNKELRRPSRPLGPILSALRSISSVTQVPVRATRSSAPKLRPVSGPMWSIVAAFLVPDPGLQANVGARQSIVANAQVIVAVLRSMMEDLRSILDRVQKPCGPQKCQRQRTPPHERGGAPYPAGEMLRSLCHPSGNRVSASVRSGSTR
jgi:hypothetical protein